MVQKNPMGKISKIISYRIIMTFSKVDSARPLCLKFFIFLHYAHGKTFQWMSLTVLTDVLMQTCTKYAHFYYNLTVQVISL